MEIYCKACYLYQEWKKQTHCVGCGNRLSNWHVAGQLERRTDGQIAPTVPARNLYPKSN